MEAEIQARRQPAFVALSIVGMAFALAGCADFSLSRKEDDDALHRHNWWDYYAHGKRCLEQNRIEEAKADFETALGIRGRRRYGYPRDTWRARTYGLHVIEGYFPHRELGVCYYRLGEWDKAVEYLQASLTQVPSGRAKYYLNRAREGLLESRALPGPRIDLEDPPGVIWSKERIRRVKGTAAGEGYVCEVLINGEKQFLELAERVVPFEKHVELQEGRNVITLAARDLTDQETRRSVTCIADWSPPKIFIEQVERRGGEAVVHGVCVDDHGLAKVMANGDPLQDPGSGGPGQKTMRFRLRSKASQPILLVAVDLAGNELSLVLSSEDLANVGVKQRQFRLAMSESDARMDAGPPMPTASPGQDGFEDHEAPAIHLSGAGSVIRLFDEEYWLDVDVQDDGGLGYVRVNGKDMLPPGSEGAIQFRCAERIALDLGTNVMTISMADIAGNATNEQVVVIRRRPEYLDTRHRLSLAISPTTTDAPESRLRARVQSRLEHEIAREPVRFYLVDRDKAWRRIGREKLLSLSSLGDPRAVLNVERLLPVELLLLSRVLRDGEGKTILACVVDTQAESVLCEEDVYLEGQGDLGYQVAGLVMKVEQDFPIVKARVRDLVRNGVVIDAGARQGVREGSRFLIIRPGERSSFEEGEVLLAGEGPAEIMISKVADATGKGRLVPASVSSDVRVGHYVFTR